MNDKEINQMLHECIICHEKMYDNFKSFCNEQIALEIDQMIFDKMYFNDNLITDDEYHSYCKIINERMMKLNGK